MFGYVRIFIIAVVALAVLSGTAKATTLTSPAGTAYTSTIKAESGELTLHEVFGATITCGKSSLEGKVEQHGNGVTAKGNLSSLTFSECGNHVTVKAAGSLEVHPTGGGNGLVTSSSAEISIQMTALGITCVYTTNSTALGTLTGSNSTKATLDLEGSKIPRTGGSFFCGSSGEMTGSYTVTTPSTLYVDEKVQGSTLTSPEGTAYTSTVKAASEGEVTLHGAGTVVCKTSSLEGTLEQHGTEIAAGGKLSSLSFGECGSNHVTVLKPGSLEVHSIGGGEGTVTSSGAEITINLTSVGVACIYTTNNTDIGTLTGSNSINATLDIKGAAIPRASGDNGLFCGGAGTLTGSYKVTTPGTLSVDEGVDPEEGSTLTSPSGTAYTSTVKAASEGEVTLHGAGTVTCKTSSLEGKVEQHGTEIAAGGKLSSLSFGECGSNHVTVLKPGSLEVHSIGGGEGTVTSSGAEITINLTSVGVACIYTTNNTDIGTLTGSNSTNATLDIKGAAIPRASGDNGLFCGGAGTLTGNYKVTTPGTLSVDS